MPLFLGKTFTSGRAFAGSGIGMLAGAALFIFLFYVWIASGFPA